MYTFTDTCIYLASLQQALTWYGRKGVQNNTKAFIKLQKSNFQGTDILTVQLSTYRKRLIHTKEDLSFTFDPSFTLATINTSKMTVWLPSGVHVIT